MIRLQKTLYWRSAITYDDGHVINQYQVTLDLLNEHDDGDAVEQAVAYHRLKWWVENVLDNSIMISEDDDMLANYEATRQRVLIMPGNPVDHLVAMVLYLKFNAIMEGRIRVAQIRLSSEQGDNMTYLHSDERDGGITDNRGWWISSGPQWHDRPATDDKNVVDLSSRQGWSEIGLDWQQGRNDKPGTVLRMDGTKP